MAKDMNLPWTAERHEVPRFDGPIVEWLVLDCWHVVIGRFDREEQAHFAVKAANREAYTEIASHRDAMVSALAIELGHQVAERTVDTLLGRIRRVEGLD